MPCSSGWTPPRPSGTTSPRPSRPPARREPGCRGRARGRRVRARPPPPRPPRPPTRPPRPPATSTTTTVMTTTAAAGRPPGAVMVPATAASPTPTSSCTPGSGSAGSCRSTCTTRGGVSGTSPWRSGRGTPAAETASPSSPVLEEEQLDPAAVRGPGGAARRRGRPHSRHRHGRHRYRRHRRGHRGWRRPAMALTPRRGRAGSSCRRTSQPARAPTPTSGSRAAARPLRVAVVVSPAMCDPVEVGSDCGCCS